MAQSKQKNILRKSGFNLKMLAVFLVAFVALGSWLLYSSMAGTAGKIEILDHSDVAGLGSDPRVVTTPDLEGVPFVGNNGDGPPLVTGVDPGGTASYIPGRVDVGNKPQICFIVKVPYNRFGDSTTRAKFTIGGESKEYNLTPSPDSPAPYTPICMTHKLSSISVSVESGFRLYVYQVQLSS
jgi:hypothetical protein